MSKPRILLHWDVGGTFHYAAEPGIDIVCVDEQCRDERVYLTTGGASPKMIDLIISGECQDPTDALRKIDSEPKEKEPSPEQIWRDKVNAETIRQIRQDLDTSMGEAKAIISKETLLHILSKAECDPYTRYILEKLIMHGYRP